MPPSDNRSIGIAFQGGSFLAGAVETGVVSAFAKQKIFDRRKIRAFSGTSAGALVAAHCWRESVRDERDRDYPALAQNLRDFWLKFALGTIPNQDMGDFWKSFDQIARLNPAYDAMADNLSIPMVQGMFRDWIKVGIDPVGTLERLLKRKDESALPRLAVGAADLLRGNIVNFVDQNFVDAATTALTGVEIDLPKDERLAHLDLSGLRQHTAGNSGKTQKACAVGGELMLSALMASGSLDELNGTTTIETGPLAGTYVDGAWGQNPPLDVMIDMGVTEIWTVEIFPKTRALAPTTHREREDRKEELWQNSTVEQQINTINKINKLLESGQLTPCKKPDDEHGKTYHPITIHRMIMPLDFTPGARIVNDRPFLERMMKIGEVEAMKFLEKVRGATR